MVKEKGSRGEEQTERLAEMLGRNRSKDSYSIWMGFLGVSIEVSTSKNFEDFPLTAEIENVHFNGGSEIYNMSMDARNSITATKKSKSEQMTKLPIFLGENHCDVQ